MNIEELYHFLFETMPGIGILVGGGLVISITVYRFRTFAIQRIVRTTFTALRRTV